MPGTKNIPSCAVKFYAGGRIKLFVAKCTVFIIQSCQIPLEISIVWFLLCLES